MNNIGPTGRLFCWQGWVLRAIAIYWIDILSSRMLCAGVGLSRIAHFVCIYYYSTVSGDSRYSHTEEEEVGE